jgi:hypothetical protein
MSSNHPVVQLLEKLSNLVNNPGRGGKEQPLINEYYNEVTSLDHLIQSGYCPLAFNYTYESLFYEARVSLDEGRQIKEAKDHNEEFNTIFQERMISKCFTMDGSKMRTNHL